MTHAVHQAIANNMDWYDAQCAAHGIERTRSNAYWCTQAPMPPLYSNLVWAGDELPAAPLRQLSASGLSRWSVKDAFGRWDLSAFGLTRLFDAHWYVRPSGAPSLPHVTDVRRIASAAELQHWVDAWGETPPGAQIFVPAMLPDPRVDFLIHQPGSGTPSGLIVNRSADCVGLSNFFGPLAGVLACIADAAARYPEFPLVGYDRVVDLDPLLPYGFEATGPLSVWIADT